VVSTVGENARNLQQIDCGQPRAKPGSSIVREAACSASKEAQRTYELFDSPPAKSNTDAELSG